MQVVSVFRQLKAYIEWVRINLLAEQESESAAILYLLIAEAISDYALNQAVMKFFAVINR